MIFELCLQEVSHILLWKRRTEQRTNSQEFYELSQCEAVKQRDAL